ncbi:MAG TPA: glycosyltransferase family 4 protein [Vicinamibacteria bacterium]
MRVLIVTQYFWPESFRVNDLALGLQERGHEVTVLTGMPNYPTGRLFPGYGLFRPARESYHGIPVLRVPLLPRGGSRWRLALNYAWFVASASLLGPLRARGPFDVILAYEPSPIFVGLPAALLRRLKRAPLLFWVQDLWPESLAATGAAPSPLVLGPVRALVRFIYRRCDRVLVQAEGFRPRVEAVGARPDTIAYFPNWAESFYRPVEVEAGAPERAEMGDGFRVLFAGNIGAAQSFETILAAAERLRGRAGLRLLVMGDGHRRAWLEEEVRARGLGERVHLMGSRPATSMPRYFALADALLVTLRRDPIFALTVPSKLQTYLACGRPVVAALDGEGARIVEEAQAGLACPAEDAAGLAAAISSLYDRPRAERETMGRNARSYFEAHFEREALLTQLEGWMRECAS